MVYMLWQYSRALIPLTIESMQVDCVVTTAGGIEEDFIKCLAPTFLGDFAYKGSDLRQRGSYCSSNILHLCNLI
jgi:deoxyhypusine synthase